MEKYGTIAALLNTCLARKHGALVEPVPKDADPVNY